MDNHNRSKKHAENVSRLLLELGEDANDDPDGDNGDDNENKDDDDLDVASADDVELADDLPDLSQAQSR